MYTNNNCANDVNKLWILSKYSRYNFEESTWNTLDSSTCISPITLTISPSCHLIINYEKEIQECINLWNCKDTCQAIFKGSSLLFSHKTKDFIGKFRVKFLSYNNKSAEENCLLCVNQLKSYLQIVKLDDATTSNTQQACDITQSQIVIDPQQLQQQPQVQPQQQQQHYQSFGVLSNNSASIISSTTPMDTNVATKRTDDVTSSLFLQNNQMAQILLKQNENSLPFVLQQDTDDIINDDQSLKEFITCCLLDTKFPQFVDKIDKILNEIVTNELNTNHK